MERVPNLFIEVKSGDEDKVRVCYSCERQRNLEAREKIKTKTTKTKKTKKNNK
jgi:hypothetical protein